MRKSDLIELTAPTIAREMPIKNNRQNCYFAAVVIVMGLGLLLSGCSDRASAISMQKKSVTSFAELLAISTNALPQIDIGRVNLLCASGLPGAGDLDFNHSLAVLDQMAQRVRSETERNFHNYQENPSQYKNSANFYRMALMFVVLAEDFQVHYAANKIGSVGEARMRDGFFADAHDVFLHGLTGMEHAGTCSSMPVLQVAVGRRLGYPLKLVTTKGHLFVRWEDANERFNVEAAGNGVNQFADEYYQHWPYEVTENEMQAEGYLKSLTASEELAVFVSIRGMCWLEAGKYSEAAECFRTSARLAPAVHSYGLMAGKLEKMSNIGIRTKP